MNTNGSDCPDRLAEAERRLLLVQGSVLTLINQRQHHITTLTLIAQAKTLEEANNMAQAALKK